jgi:trk system potassium uptake protein TrkA
VQVLIVGAGEVGSSIATSLADSHDVVVVDVDPARVEELNYSADVLAVEGDGTDLETLLDADLEAADMVIACTDSDETNIVTCGTVKTVTDAFTIARVKEATYLETWERVDRAFGVDFMVGTNLLAARAIVQVLGVPAARDVDAFAGGRVQMAEFEIPEASPIAGQTVQEADRFDSLTFAAILRPDDLVIPTGGTVINHGDEVVVIGSSESVRELAAEIAPHHGETSDILIVGGCNIGYQTARLLEAKGFHPRLVERDHERARELAELLPGTTVLEHDATERDFLEREHIEKVGAFIATLSSDEQNLMACLIAKRMGADRTVAVVEETEYVDLFEEVGVDVAINPREATAAEITRFTRERRAENVALVESDRAEVMEFEVGDGSVLVDRPIRESVGDLPPGVVVGAITRNGEFVIPRGDTVVRAGDHVVLFVDACVVEEVTAHI